jgi:Domain of unknown function (DUF4440)
MRRRLMVALVAAPLVAPLVSPLVSPLGAQTDSASLYWADSRDASLIRARRESSNRAIARHDSAGFAAILAESVVVVTSASARYAGRTTYVNSMLSQFRARPDVVYRREPNLIRVFAPWRMASEAGIWVGSWTEPDGKVSIGGRYFAKWRQIGDAWVVESEVYVPEHCTGSAFCTRVP